LAVGATPGVWSAQNTGPADVEAAIRALNRSQQGGDGVFAPARVLNLIVIVDREWRGEIYNRLDRVGRYHPSRTILCAVEPGRGTIDAWVSTTAERDPGPGELALVRERVVLDVGPRHLANLETIVDPLVISDITTVVWAPHGHDEAVNALLGHAQVVLVDSINQPDPRSAVTRARELADDAYVVDLAWLRSTPWRERVAATFDPPRWRSELARISGVTVRHHPDSGTAALLLVGWLSCRLGWEPGSLVAQNGSLTGRARGRRAEVRVALDPDPGQRVPGLAGLTIETASGMSISLDRGAGGLTARRRTPDGRESIWTVLGASRGEGGILGEGIRQALLRDPTYRPALACAEAMLG
jgi:glucose-6-phosphate dehydrogenase assembly protein OpcA